MSARLAAALGLLLFGSCEALAQPAVPPADMAGRERFRFIESPVERQMRPGPTVEEPLIRVERRKKHWSRKHTRRRYR